MPPIFRKNGKFSEPGHLNSLLLPLVKCLVSEPIPSRMRWGPKLMLSYPGGTRWRRNPVGSWFPDVNGPGTRRVMAEAIKKIHARRYPWWPSLIAVHGLEDVRVDDAWETLFGAPSSSDSDSWEAMEVAEGFYTIDDLWHP